MSEPSASARYYFANKLMLTKMTALTSTRRWPVLINAVLFQLLWFACVLGSANRLFIPALCAFLLLAAFQLRAHRRAEGDYSLLILSLALGILIDSLWLMLGFVEFTDPRPLPFLAPAWILVLWAGFALTINHSMAWVNAHPLLPGVLGAVGGPLSYLAGERLGAVAFLVDRPIVLTAIGLAWAFAMTVFAQAAAGRKQIG